MRKHEVNQMIGHIFVTINLVSTLDTSNTGIYEINACLSKLAECITEMVHLRDRIQEGEE